MHEMHWTFDELQATPMYVRQYVWALICARRQAEHDANERARRDAQRAR